MRETTIDNVDYYYGKKIEKADDLIIIFTNDMHCGIDEGISMAGVASIKKKLSKHCKNVMLVDCGDAIQGSYLGTVSKGEIVVDVMNEIGYDLCIFGNHEFDYGMERLVELLKKSKAQYLNCNGKYIGNDTDTPENEALYKELIKPYVIKEFNGHKIGFIGITTPVTLSSSTPAHFKKNGIFVYDFSGSGDGKELYDVVQKTVDEVRNLGAEVVVALAHLGMDSSIDSEDPYSSINVIKNTSGIDILLDGHSHSTYSSYCVENKDGDLITIAQTGTKLSSLGYILISSQGTIAASLVGDYKYRDEEIDNKVKTIINKYQKQLGKVIGHSDYDLLTCDSNGIRLSRNREIALGNLVSDAFRNISGADFAYVNGGGLRADIKKGDITYLDSISVNPFGNMLCVIEVTGQEIVDMLEFFTKDTQIDYVDSSGISLGENGSFPHMSGIRFNLDLSITPTINVDENENLLSISNNRRVTNVEVLENNKYIPIDLNKTYTLCTNDYMAKNGGCGMDLFLKNHKIVLDSIISDYECMVNYIINVLNGDLSKYKNIDNRIIIK